MKKIKILSFHLFISLFIAINFSTALINLSKIISKSITCQDRCTEYDYNYGIFIITAIVIGLFLGVMKLYIFKLELLTLTLWPLWYFIMGLISPNDDFHIIVVYGLVYTIPIIFCTIVPNALVIKLSVGKKALRDAYWEERKHWVK